MRLNGIKENTFVVLRNGSIAKIVGKTSKYSSLDSELIQDFFGIYLILDNANGLMTPKIDETDWDCVDVVTPKNYPEYFL